MQNETTELNPASCPCNTLDTNRLVHGQLLRARHNALALQGPASSGGGRSAPDAEAGAARSEAAGGSGTKGSSGRYSGAPAERQPAGCCGRDPLLAATLIGETRMPAETFSLVNAWAGIRRKNGNSCQACFQHGG